MTSDPKAPSAPAIILYREVDRDDNRLTPHEDNFIRIKVFAEEGRKYADVEIPFYKQNEDITHIQARTIKPDGTVVNFGGQVYEKPLIRSKSERILAKTFTLTDVEVGSIIEYSYTMDFKEHYIYESHWILSQELFTKNARFSLKPYENKSYIAQVFNLRWTWQGLPPGSTPAEGPDKVVRMSVTEIPAFQIEDHMPPEDEMKARVDFVYDPETTVNDSAEYWKRINKKRNEQLESFVGKQKEMQSAVSQIVSPNDSPDVKLQKIYARVQQLRNTSYEVHKSEEELKRDNQKPIENVAELWSRGYGNGVQLTWLFLGLTRAAGLDASGCWVSSRRQYFFNPNLMQSGKLNSNVVRVKLNGKDMYFDPGGAYAPFGLVHWYETGTRGLCLNKDSGEWVITTLPNPEESQVQRSAKLNLLPTGDLEGKLTVTYTGLEAMYRRIEERNADDVARKKFLEEQNQEQVPAAAELELTNQPDWKSSDAPLVAEFNLKVPGWVSSAGTRALLPATLFTVSEKHMFEHANRVHPIYFDYPFTKLEDVTIALPSGWKVSSMPAPKVEDGHIVYYSLSADSGGSTVHTTRKYLANILLIDQKYYSALHNFYQTMRTADDVQIVLQPGNATASN